MSGIASSVGNHILFKIVKFYYIKFWRVKYILVLEMLLADGIPSLTLIGKSASFT